MIAPIKNFKPTLYPYGSVTQYYGENIELYKSAVGLNGHNGIDIVDTWGTPLYAVEDGIVADVKNDSTGYGMHIRIFSKDIKREWSYGHCSAVKCNIGDTVKAGDVIATMGNTGFVVSGDTPYWGTNPSKGTSHPGTHLHLGLRLIKEYKKGWSYGGSDIKIKVLNYDNGKKGAVDPLPYLTSTLVYNVLMVARKSTDSVWYQFANLLTKINL